RLSNIEAFIDPGIYSQPVCFCSRRCELPNTCSACRTLIVVAHRALYHGHVREIRWKMRLLQDTPHRGYVFAGLTQRGRHMRPVPTLIEVNKPSDLRDELGRRPVRVRDEFRHHVADTVLDGLIGLAHTDPVEQLAL